MNEKLLKAIEDGQVKDETTLAVFEMLQAIEDKMDSKEIEKVEVTNFPEDKEPVINVEAPVVTVPAPVVNVEAPIVNVDTKELALSLEELKTILSEIKNGKPFTLDNFGQNGRIRVEVDRVGSFSSFAIVDAIKEGPTMLATQIDDVSTSGMTYVGYATIGTATSAAFWQIQRIDESGTPVTTVIKWADGNANFDNIWNNRTSLTYT